MHSCILYMACHKKLYHPEKQDFTWSYMLFYVLHHSNCSPSGAVFLDHQYHHDHDHQIVLPPGVNRVPRSGRKLSNKQLTGSSFDGSTSKTFSGNSNAFSKQPTSSSGNLGRVASSPDSLSSPLVFTRSGPTRSGPLVSSRRSSAPQNFRQPLRQSQQIR